MPELEELVWAQEEPKKQWRLALLVEDELEEC
jgi:hypothetical protein